MRHCKFAVMGVLITRDSSEKPYSRSSAAASGAVPGEPYDDRAEELMDLLGMLYFTVEVFRTDETFGDELSEYRDTHISGRRKVDRQWRCPRPCRSFSFRWSRD